MGESSTGPTYGFAWNNVAVGNYRVTAVAIDNRGGVKASVPQMVTVQSTVSVGLTAPQNYSMFVGGNNVTVSAQVNNGGGRVSRVEFYANRRQNRIKLGEDATAPYSITWKPTIGDAYDLTAVAIIEGGAEVPSVLRRVYVDKSPGVSISAPADNAVFHGPQDITITSQTGDCDGSVVQVEFYVNNGSGNQLLRTVTTAPFRTVWTNVALGTYTLTAKAFDNLGVTSTSRPVKIKVNNPPPPPSPLQQPIAG